MFRTGGSEVGMIEKLEGLKLKLGNKKFENRKVFIYGRKSKIVPNNSSWSIVNTPKVSAKSVHVSRRRSKITPKNAAS